jgi:D-alanyl-D-alanine carboxypeptidase
MKEKIEVSPVAPLVPGTTANLKSGDVLTLWQMLHAMMLPSGNDAAICVADHFGNLIIKEKTDNKATLIKSPQQSDLDLKR